MDKKEEATVDLERALNSTTICERASPVLGQVVPEGREDYLSVPRLAMSYSSGGSLGPL